MPSTARSLGVVTAGAVLLVALAWIVVRTLVGPDVPVVPAAVELGAPADPADADADADSDEASRRVEPGEAAARPAHRSGSEAEVTPAAGDGTRVLGARTDRGPLVVSPQPVSLVEATRDGSPAVPSAPAAAPVPSAPAAAPTPSVPIVPPAPEGPDLAPAPPSEESTTSRDMEVADGDGCAMPEHAGHGLGRAKVRTEGSPAASPPRGQHQRGCSVPEPAARPQPAATLPAQASPRGHDDADAPGRGGGPAGAGRGRGPKG